MARCRLCGQDSPLTALSPQACGSCLRSHPTRFDAVLDRGHKAARAPFGLPLQPPNDGRRFFGGDPTPRMPHALAAAERARRNRTGLIGPCARRGRPWGP
jgi:hypothetical protein